MPQLSSQIAHVFSECLNVYCYTKLLLYSNEL